MTPQPRTLDKLLKVALGLAGAGSALLAAWGAVVLAYILTHRNKQGRP